jgi:lipoprotein-anchoring transpeptidase ErfK/SrfK
MDSAARTVGNRKNVRSTSRSSCTSKNFGFLLILQSQVILSVRFRNVTLPARLVICLGMIAVSGTNGHSESKRDRRQIEEATRVQIFLDNSNFGPGKIDGKDGEFTRKAITLFKRSQGQADSVAQNSETPIDTTGLDLASVDPVFTTYVVTKGDIENVGELPSDVAAQAKLKWLPYRSVAEAVAEKFHCDITFLKELNPTITEKLKEGDQVTVPNVKPFELSAVRALEPGSDAAGIVANELGEQDEKGQSQTGEAAEEVKEKTPPFSLHISTKEEILEVHDGGKLVAAFPVTVGSQDTASPIGHWTVKAIAKLPNFRYDLKMLNEGERGSSFYMLPPGPNNPAGVIWIALNKKGIGIHGASDPDSIGRSASHGCIRLANWDVAKLAGMVKPGGSVVVE